MKKKLFCLTFLILALAAALAVTALADSDASLYSVGGEVNVPDPFTWTFNTMDGGVVTNRDYNDMTRLLLFVRANGICSASNATMKTLAEGLGDGSWGDMSRVKIILVGVGEPGDTLEMVRRNMESFLKRNAPGFHSDTVVTAYTNSSRLMWDYNSVIHGDDQVWYAEAVIIDSSNVIRYIWTSGYSYEWRTPRLLAAVDESAGVEPDAFDEYTFAMDGTYDDGLAYRLVERLNELRAQAGKGPMTADEHLVDAARQMATEYLLQPRFRPNYQYCATIPHEYFPDNNIHFETVTADTLDDAVRKLTSTWEEGSGYWLGGSMILEEDYVSIGAGVLDRGNGEYVWAIMLGYELTSPAVMPEGGVSVRTSTVPAIGALFDLTASASMANVPVGESKSVSLYARGREELKLEKMSERYGIKAGTAWSDDPSVATAELTPDGSVVIRGIQNGATTVHIGVSPVKSSDRPKEVSVAVNVGERLFTDVAIDSYYDDSVTWAIAHNVTNGTTETTFSPDDPCTHAEIITFLWRAAGMPEADPETEQYSNVKEGAYYYDAVLWARGKMITGLFSFEPDEECTREDAVTYLWFFSRCPWVPYDGSFIDVPMGGNTPTVVGWAVQNGITNGTSKNTFSPDKVCSRAEIVTFLYRLMNS